MRWPAFVGLAALVGACSSPVIYLRSHGSKLAPLPDEQAFRISPDPAPAGSQRVGDAAFFTAPRTLHLAILKLRRRVLRLGGNRIASLRCQPASPLRLGIALHVPRSLPIKTGQKIHCAGQVYRDPRLIRPRLAPPPPSPARRRP
jgi:hypothetical protein